MANFHGTELDVHPLCLGGNVFSWTADQPAAFAVLDAYAAAGGNFIDSADAYGRLPPGTSTGGGSETIVGRWMAQRGNRADIVLATKAGRQEGPLTAATVARKAEASLRRLQTEHIDLYYVHYDDAVTPLEETLGAFDALVRAGKVRHVALSNFSAERLVAAVQVTEREGFARPVALQQHYNLMDRDRFEGELRAACERLGLGTAPYFALARGFLSGKYRPDGPSVDSPRSEAAGAYLDARGRAVLEALDEVSAAHDTTVAAVALAWLAAQPTVVSPIASARTVEQLAGLLPMAELQLTADELARLDAVSAPQGAASA
jgi:aryl-alcohol dehydrogenase-like predicted oxidoreductase